ncbi:MAG: hypothetical protein WCW17_00845 [Patescibacteria group bacterium]|jgi:hypothetical protein
MNEGLNYKIILGLVLMIIVLFFGVNFITSKYLVKNNSSNKNTNSSEVNYNQNENSNSQAYSNSNTNETIVENSESLTNADYVGLGTTLQAYTSRAQEIAANWQKDLIISNLTIELDSNLETGKSKQTFTYASTSNTDYWFTISFSENSQKYVRAIIPKEDYLGNTLKPIQLSYWKINYIQAFQLAEKYQGASYREKNKANVSLSLTQGDPKGWLWWIVTYKSTTTSGNVYTVRINANTGEICDENGAVIKNP